MPDKVWVLVDRHEGDIWDNLFYASEASALEEARKHGTHLDGIPEPYVVCLARADVGFQHP